MLLVFGQGPGNQGTRIGNHQCVRQVSRSYSLPRPDVGVLFPGEIAIVLCWARKCQSTIAPRAGESSFKKTVAYFRSIRVSGRPTSRPGIWNRLACVVRA